MVKERDLYSEVPDEFLEEDTDSRYLQIPKKIKTQKNILFGAKFSLFDSKIKRPPKNSLFKIFYKQHFSNRFRSQFSIFFNAN